MLSDALSARRPFTDDLSIDQAAGVSNALRPSGYVQYGGGATRDDCDSGALRPCKNPGASGCVQVARTDARNDDAIDTALSMHDIYAVLNGSVPAWHYGCCAQARRCRRRGSRARLQDGANLAPRVRGQRRGKESGESGPEVEASVEHLSSTKPSSFPVWSPSRSRTRVCTRTRFTPHQKRPKTSKSSLSRCV